MKPTSLVRSVALGIAMAAAGTAAFTEGDIYSRRFEMRQMDRSNDGMVSKGEFLAMVAKRWDMHSIEIKLKGGKMSAEQIKEVEKILGRTLDEPAAR